VYQRWSTFGINKCVSEWELQYIYYIAVYILIKKFPEFIQKIQNTILFIKSDIVPFKVPSIDNNALMPALDPVLETFLELYCQSRLRFFHYLLSAVKTFPVMVFWSNRKKSVSQHFQGFHTIESIFNAKFNTNSLLQIQLHF